jgi:hypothetical protein
MYVRGERAICGYCYVESVVRFDDKWVCLSCCGVEEDAWNCEDCGRLVAGAAGRSIRILP